MNKKKLHLGSGTNLVTGWINVDNNFDNNIDLKKLDLNWDLTKTLPYENNSIDLIFHEHFIEHLEKIDGHHFLQDCYRILKPGGVMRLGWPDMQRILDAYAIKDKKLHDYVKPHIVFSVWDSQNWDEFLSDCLFNWDHRYNYTRDHMKKLLLEIGFKEVKEKKYMESDFGFDIDVRNDPVTTFFEAVK